MKVNGKVLNSFQTNFLKDLMGDTFMTDTRAEANLSRLASKYNVDVAAMVEAAAAPYEKKHAEFKKLEAEEAAS